MSAMPLDSSVSDPKILPQGYAGGLSGGYTVEKEYNDGDCGGARAQTAKQHMKNLNFLRIHQKSAPGGRR